MGFSKPVSVVEGGTTRQESSSLGLATAPAGAQLIAVHDAARPLVSEVLITALLDTATVHGATVPATPICDTIKKGTMNGVIDATADRSELFAVQTPQVFASHLLRRAHSIARETTLPFTDDAALVEQLGEPVRLYPGDPTNIKITTPQDLEEARRLWSVRNPSESRNASNAFPDIRIGMGYDIHRFALDRPLMLGGVRFDHPLGLDGHSDADVLLHAVCDALLGASGLGDIGHMFPNTDVRYKNTSSLLLLREVRGKVEADGWLVQNVDISLVAEAPQLAPKAEQIRATIAETLGIPSDRIGLKATTNEQLGAIGRGEGAACFAVALLMRS